METTASELTWRKSSHSGGEGGDCVEVAATAGFRWLRDSKHPEASPSPFSEASWQAFLHAVT